MLTLRAFTKRSFSSRFNKTFNNNFFSILRNSDRRRIATLDAVLELVEILKTKKGTSFRA